MKQKTNWIVLSLFFVVTILLRFIAHPWNFSSIFGLAVVGTAFMNRKQLSWVLPLAALWLSNLILNNTIYASYFDGFTFISKDLIWAGLAFIALSLIAIPILKKVNWSTIVIAAVVAPILFFLLTNFGVWMSGITYPMNMGGLIACFVAALPFLASSLLSSVCFSLVMFAIYKYATEGTLTAIPAVQKIK